MGVVVVITEVGVDFIKLVGLKEQLYYTVRSAGDYLNFIPQA